LIGELETENKSDLTDKLEEIGEEIHKLIGELRTGKRK